MQKGASGYVTKNSTREEMFEALEQISTGKKYICREIKNKLSEQMLNGIDTHKAIDSLRKEK